MKSIDRAVALATSTLEFGREPPPKKNTIVLGPLVSEVAQSVLGDAPAIVLDNRIAQDFAVEADREQLFRVILNLVRNAAEALAVQGGVIAVSAMREGGRVRIDIADNGPGVPQAVREKLFEPFASAARSGGSGLGLAIARELTRGHGGDLVLVSTGPEGTVFRIALPG